LRYIPVFPVRTVPGGLSLLNTCKPRAISCQNYFVTHTSPVSVIICSQDCGIYALSGTNRHYL